MWYRAVSASNSGTVTATGGKNAAGLGGGDMGNAGTVTINGGMVTATGGSFGAGIGGGTVTINGGVVTATGGDSAAGIGGGATSDGGTVTLNGGRVEASGGEDAAGISGTVTLNPNVSVWAGDRANPKVTGNPINNFATNHNQQYVFATGIKPTILGADLVLDGMLKLRFFLYLPDDFNEDSAMEMTIHGRTINHTLSDAERIDGMYVFACPVDDMEMAEPVSAIFRSSYGTAEKTTCVKAYLDEMEANIGALKLSADDEAKLKELITAVRNYGHAMQVYLAGLDGFTVGEGPGFDYQTMPAGSEIVPLTELPEYRIAWGRKRFSPNVVSYLNYFDDYNGNTTLNVDISLKSLPSNVTARVDGEQWVVKDLGRRTFRIAIPNIAPNNLGKVWHVEFIVNGQVVFDAKLSALSYLSALLDANRSQPGEREAITAFYQLYLTAKAFE